MREEHPAHDSEPAAGPGPRIWIVATADIGVFTDIGDKMTRYHVTCHDIGLIV
jgi:hypothetical protein